jgi:hypothetical protein
MPPLHRPGRLAGPATAVAVTVGVAASAIAASTGNAAPRGGTIHVVEVGTISAPKHSIVITGAFADAGTFGPPSSGGTIELRLSQGTITVDESRGAAKENAIFGNIGKYVDAATCGLAITYTAPATILSGTGAYAGIGGTVTTTTRDAAVFPRRKNGTCDVDANPSGFIDTGIGAGSVSLM